MSPWVAPARPPANGRRKKKKYLEDAAKQREANTEQLEDQLKRQKGLWDKHRQAVKDKYEDLDDTAKKEEELASARDETEKARIDADETLTPEERAAKKQEIDDVAEHRRFVGREESRGRAMAEALETETGSEQAYEQAASKEAEQAQKVADLERVAHLKAEKRIAEMSLEASKPQIEEVQERLRMRGQQAQLFGENDTARKGREADEGLLARLTKARERNQSQSAMAGQELDELQQRIDPNADLGEERKKLDELKKNTQGTREQYEKAYAEREQVFEKTGKDSPHDRAMFAERQAARQVQASAPAPAEEASAAPQIAEAGQAAADANAEIGVAAQEMATRIADSTSQSAGDMRRAASSIDQGFGGLQAAITDLARAVQQNAARTEQVQQTAAAALQAAADLRATVRPMIRQ
jgi:hypothetical protein